MNRELLRRIKYALFGLGVGVISAAFGIGGGSVTVPVLVLFTGFDIKRAVGSSLAALAPVALVGVAAHLLIDRGNLDLPLAGYAVIGALAGAGAGIKLHGIVRSSLLEKLFAVLLLAVAVKLAGVPGLFSGAGQMRMPAPYMVMVGFFGGICSSLFGIGGGIIFVPGLYFLFGMPMNAAAATSLTVIVPTALAGGALHMRSGNVDLRFVEFIVPFAVVGAVAGALAANRIPSEALKLAFAAFMFASAFRLFFRKPEGVEGL